MTDGQHLSRSVSSAESASSDFVHREIVVLAVLIAIAVGCLSRDAAFCRRQRCPAAA